MTLMHKESSGDPNSYNDKNNDGSVDYGLMQVNSKTADEYGFDKYRLQHDPIYNMQAAAKEIQGKIQMLKRKGIPVTAFNIFKAYNGWSSAGERYANDAMNFYNQLT